LYPLQRLSRLLAVAQTNAVAAPGISPRDSPFFANDPAGAAFHAALPEKFDTASVVDTIVLYRTDIQAGFLAALFADGAVYRYMGRMIKFEPDLGQLVVNHHNNPFPPEKMSLIKDPNGIFPLRSSSSNFKNFFLG